MRTTPLSPTSRIPLSPTPPSPTGRSHAPWLNSVQLACMQVLVCTFFWGAFYVLGKVAVSEAPPLVVATLRFLLAGGLLLGLLVVREPGFPRLTRRDAVLIFGLGFTGVFAFNAFTFQGFLYAPSSDAALINPSLNPVITALLATVLFGERLWRMKIYGMGLSIIGLVILFASHGAGESATPSHRWLGDLFFVLSAVAWSAYTLLTRVALKRFSSLALTTYTAIAGLLMLLPFSARDLVQVPWAALSGRFWLSVAMLAFLCTVLSFLLWNGAIRRAGASRAASFLPLVPVFSLALGAIVLQEEFTLVHGLVVACSIVGVSLANKPKRLRIHYKARRTIKRARIAAVRGLYQVVPSNDRVGKPSTPRFTNQLTTPKRKTTGFLG